MDLFHARVQRGPSEAARCARRPIQATRSFLPSQVIKHSSNTSSRLQISSVYTENTVGLFRMVLGLNNLRMLKKVVQQGRSR